jgi:hypothetical protein
MSYSIATAVENSGTQRNIPNIAEADFGSHITIFMTAWNERQTAEASGL